MKICLGLDIASRKSYIVMAQTHMFVSLMLVSNKISIIRQYIYQSI